MSIGARYNGDEVDTKTVAPLLEISKHLIIEGTGGIGKSMLLRYLFLKTAIDGDYIPVLLTLRKINDQSADQIDLFQLIDTCMAEFDKPLPPEQFKYSLKSGKYLFLLDGLDEVKQELADKTIEAIQTFCQKYPDNPCIITSRPRQNLMPLETFTVVQSKPLRREQAVELASKLDPENEKTEAFCRQLEEELFDKHKDFAENPLLLGMMFLTFTRTNNIPDHLADFYGKTFDALYSLHDSTNKGTYQREFRCKELDEPSFKKLLSYFCFQSYFHEDYEFSKDSILAYIEKGIQKLELSQVRAQDFIDDLCDAVCILMQEGDPTYCPSYRFSHRNFQTYFAARYTRGFSDEQQKQLFSQYCFPDNATYMWLDYCDLMIQIDPHRFAINAVEPYLRSLQMQTNRSPCPDIFILKLICEIINFDSDSVFLFPNVFGLCGLMYLFSPDYNIYSEFVYCKSIVGFLQKVKGACPVPAITFERIDSSTLLTDEERIYIYTELAKVAGIPEIRAAIRDWLQKLDEQRVNLKQKGPDDFLKSL